jgi:hypothetical protein
VLRAGARLCDRQAARHLVAGEAKELHLLAAQAVQRRRRGRARRRRRVATALLVEAQLAAEAGARSSSPGDSKSVSLGLT